MRTTLTAVRLPGTGERILVRGDYTSLADLTYNGDGTWSAMRCYCPADCNCRHQDAPWHRFNYCGCKQHSV